MTPLEPHMEELIGHSALQVWIDFWELTGRMRADIVRRTETGRDPEMMTPGEVAEAKVAQVPVIMIGMERDVVHSRASEIPLERIKMEFIDCVRNTDSIVVNGMEHEVDSVEGKVMGDFSIWIVVVHRV